jgi:hypothetical protein
MAEDIRAALARLAWIERAEISLVDHFASRKINAAIAAGEDFRSAFGAESGGNLDALRQKFREKAFLGRMSALIDSLRDEGVTDDELLALTMADLARRRDRPARGYLELRAEFGGPANAGDPAFRASGGSPIPADGLVAFLRGIRMSRRGVEANGEMCRALLRARNETPIPAS